MSDDETPGISVVLATFTVMLAVFCPFIIGVTTCSADNFRRDISLCVAAGATLESCYKQYAGENK